MLHFIILSFVVSLKIVRNIKESQNARDRKGPLEIILYNLLLKHVPCNRLHRKPFRQVLNFSRAEESMISLGNLFQCCHPHSKEVLPHASVEIFTFHFMLIAPYPVTGHHWKDPGPTHLIHTHSHYLYGCLLDSF